MDTATGEALAEMTSASRAAALAAVLANRSAISVALVDLLTRNEAWRRVIDAASEWKSRQQLVTATRISSTNITKVLRPMTTRGWIDEAQGGRYRRSLAVEVVLAGSTASAWLARARRADAGRRRPRGRRP